MRKRILSALLALCMVSTLLVPASAEDPAGPVLHVEFIDLGTSVTSGDPGISLFDLGDGKVALKDTNEINWYDRLKIEDKYEPAAKAFYNALVEGANNNNINDYLIEDQYYTAAADVSFDPTALLTPGQFISDKSGFTGIYVATVEGGSDSNEVSYVSNLINAVYDAFDRDHPEVFWLTGNRTVAKITVGDSGPTYLLFTLNSSDKPIRANGYNESKIKEAITTRDKNIEKIEKTVTGTERYDIVKGFNTWLTNNNAYNNLEKLDNGPHEMRECVSALAGQSGNVGPVCEGYARAFKVLCDDAEIPCVLVDGWAKSDPTNQSDLGGDHMWNYVQMDDDKWYAVDVTWNDPGKVVADGNENYLLVGGDTPDSNNQKFSDTHKVRNIASKGDGNFTPVEFENGPELQAEKYVRVGAMPGTVTVAGTAKVGETLTASYDKGAEVTEAITPVYQWYRGSDAISGATNNTYTLVADDVGKSVTVRVTAENYSGYVTAAAIVAEKKDAPAAPSGITISDRDDKSITVTASGVSGLEYAIVRGKDQAESSITKWQDGSQFTGLTEGTEYTVFARVKETDDTKAGIAAKTNEKTKMVPKASDFTVSNDNYIYDGSEKTATVALKSGLTGLQFETSGNKATNAGSYKITVNVTANDNYIAAAELEVGTLTISKATPTISVSDNPFTITKGTTKTLGASLTGGPSGAKLSYTSSDKTVVTVDENGNVTADADAAGKSAAITVSYAGDNANYGPAESVTVTVNVTAKKEATVAFTTSNVSATYTGTAFPLKDQFTEATVTDPTGTLTTIKYWYDNTEYDFADLPTVTNVGTYTVKAVYEDDEYYGEATATFEITKADQAALTIDSNPTMKYKETLTLSTTGGSGDGAVAYTITDGSQLVTLSGDKLTAKGVGTVKVKAAKAGGQNYNDVDSSEFTITIGKADAPDNVALEETVHYSAATKEVALSGGPDDKGNVTYSAAVTSGGDIVKNAAVAGSKLTATMADGLTAAAKDKKAVITVTAVSDNYKDFNIVVNLTVVEKYEQAALTITSASSVTYPNTLTVTASGGSTDSAVAYTVADGTGSAAIDPATGVLTPTKAGTVTVTATKAGNDMYLDVSADATITINKGTPTVRPTYTPATGSGQTLADAALGLDTAGTVPPGSISWDDPLATVVTANTSYRWTFTPDSAYQDNYTATTGTIVLWKYTPPTSDGATGTTDRGESSSSGGSVSTGTGTSSGGHTTATTARPSASVSNGSAASVIDGNMGNQIVSQAIRNDSDTVVIAPDVKRGVNSASVEIPASTVQNLGSRTDADLKISTPVASVTIPNGGLTDLASSGTVTIAAAKSGSNVSVEVSVNGRQVDRVAGGVTAEIPASYCTSGTVAMLVNPNGSTTVIRKSIADPSSRTVTVPLDGSARLVISDNSKTFADVPSSSWAASAVSFISSHEIMNGTDAGRFDPSGTMTRGMLALILHNIESNPEAARFTRFPDVGDAWYAEAVQWAAGEGIVSGYNDGRFGPDDVVTREQLAVMLYRYAGQPDASGYTHTFSDSNQVNSWAKDAVRWAVGAGILSGSEGRLNPGGQATRAEAASMLMRFMQNMEK